jgi:hypothetical protein
MDLDTDVYGVGEDDLRAMELEKSTRGRIERVLRLIL